MTGLTFEPTLGSVPRHRPFLSNIAWCSAVRILFLIRFFSDDAVHFFLVVCFPSASMLLLEAGCHLHFHERSPPKRTFASIFFFFYQRRRKRTWIVFLLRTCNDERNRFRKTKNIFFLFSFSPFFFFFFFSFVLHAVQCRRQMMARIGGYKIPAALPWISALLFNKAFLKRQIFVCYVFCCSIKKGDEMTFYFPFLYFPFTYKHLTLYLI